MVIICEDPSRSMRAAREREKDRMGEGSRALERKRERGLRVRRQSEGYRH